MEIPGDKRFFRIGEVSRIIGVEPYVLRYWESVFPQIRPSRADSNQRTYQRRDLELIMEIKDLLYKEKLTIEGARQRLRQRSAKGPTLEDGFIEWLRGELQDVLRLLS
jgi:DNA-binding transcriptional MerR regulator